MIALCRLICSLLFALRFAFFSALTKSPQFLDEEGKSLRTWGKHPYIPESWALPMSLFLAFPWIPSACDDSEILRFPSFFSSKRQSSWCLHFCLPFLTRWDLPLLLAWRGDPVYSDILGWFWFAWVWVPSGATVLLLQGWTLDEVEEPTVWGFSQRCISAIAFRVARYFFYLCYPYYQNLIF